VSQLTQLGPFNLPLTTPSTFPAAPFTILASGQFSNSQLGQLAIYNYSNYLLSLYSSTDGFLLNLQPGTGNVYDPPSNGGSLTGSIIGGSAPTTGGSAYVTAQVDLAGGQILGSWPQTLSNVALPGTTNVNATQIQGVPVSATTPTLDQVLEYNGTDWVPTSLPANNWNPTWGVNGAIPTSLTPVLDGPAGASLVVFGGYVRVTGSPTYLTLELAWTDDEGASGTCYASVINLAAGTQTWCNGASVPASVFNIVPVTIRSASGTPTLSAAVSIGGTAYLSAWVQAIETGT